MTPTTVATTPADAGPAGAAADAGTTPGGWPSAERGTGRPAATYRPTKFLADLTKAMQVAAQAEREETIAQYRADAKAHIEQIRADTTDRSSDYRKQADDDVAAIRDWSKAEMARIREETDHRIADRKAELERQLQRHADRIDKAVGQVEGKVEAFEEEMARFFERLLAVEDPTTFAAMAASLPEPPAFTTEPDADVPRARSVAEPPPAPVADAPMTEAAEAASAGSTWTTPEAIATDVDDPLAEARKAAAAELAEADAATVAAGSTGPVEQVESGVEQVESGVEQTTHDEYLTSLSEEPVDPRISALGLTPSEFAAAEAEAAVDAGSDLTGDGSDGGEAVETVDEASVAARIAGLIPTETPESDHSGTIVSTQITVLGLVSVASIAGFKRHLARVPGVQSVSVSSGPDGEFVFTTVHHDDVVLRDVVTTLPGFQARVTEAADGILQVTAHDPEAEA